MKRKKKILMIFMMLISTIYSQDYYETMGIRRLWEAGYKGEGMVVMDIGPGVDIDNHPSLSDSWRGNTGEATSEWDWYDPVYGTKNINSVGVE
jgi:hypothetical protein